MIGNRGDIQVCYISYQGNLYDEDCRDAILKLLVERLVVPYPHSEHSTNRATYYSEPKECSFRDAPLVPFSLMLVYSV